MNIIPKLRTKFGESVGVEIFISPPNISLNNETFISTDSSSGASSFTVDNGLKFAVDEYFVGGNIGAEKTELERTHASTTPTATTITLAATTSTSHAHSRGEKIQFIPYNRIEIERSTDAGVSYSNLTTVNIRVDSENTYYNHTAGASTDLYRARFENEASSDVSEYSDGIIATGFVANSAGAIIDQALSDLGESIDDEVLTKKVLFDALTEGRREIDEDENIIRWEFRTVFNFNAYSIIPGQFKFTLPTNLRESATNKNILSVRFGRNKYKTTYRDQSLFDTFYNGIRHTTLNGAVITADTEITLTTSGDMDTSGSMVVAAQAIDEETDTVAYTGNTLTSNELTGVTGIRAAGHATGTDVWKGATFGEPRHYTVDNGVISFTQPFSNEIAGETVELDYYKEITDINSDADLLDEPFYNIYVPYMRYRIKKRLDKELNWKDDEDYISWVQKKNAQINKQYNGQSMQIIVDIPEL